MGNLKIMGLAIVAVLALSAVVASAASAVEYKSESTSGNTFIRAASEGSQAFNFGVAATCTEATAEAEFVGATAPTKTTGNVNYNGCTIAKLPGTLATNGCTFVFGQPTGTASPFSIPNIKLACPAGKEIVFTATAAGCTIKIGEQSTTGTTTATNNAGSPKTVTFAINISKIVYTSSGGICGSSGTTGTYTGKFLAKAFSNREHTKAVGFFIG